MAMRAHLVLPLALCLAACGGYSFKPIGSPEKAKPADCTFRVTEMPPDDYWRPVGTFEGGSAENVQAFIAAVKPDACRVGAELVVPELEAGRYVRATAYVPRKD